MSAAQLAALEATVNRLQAQVAAMDERLGAISENINLLRGDAQRMQSANVVLAGPSSSSAPKTEYDTDGVGAHGLIPAAPPNNNPDRNAEAEALAIASFVAPPTPTDQLTPEQVAANALLAGKARKTAERRAARGQSSSDDSANPTL